MAETYHRKSPFEISELAEFDKNIEGGTEEEMTAKRIAYMEQSLVQVGYGRSMFKAFGCLLIPFFIIPIFWPVLLFAYFSHTKVMKMVEAQIDFALDYWGLTRDDVLPKETSDHRLD